MDVRRRLTVAAYLPEWLQDKTDLRPTTRADYRHHIENTWVPTIGAMELSAVRRGHVEAPLEALDVSAATGQVRRAGTANGTRPRHRVSPLSSTARAGTPDQQLATPQARGGSMGVMHASSTASRSPLLGGDAGDVDYPHYVVNGRLADAPVVLTGKPGQRVRIRLVNAAADTAFRVALAGHRLSVTHSDGFPVQPVTVDALLVGMGERYDLVAELADGVFPLVAGAEGKHGVARALVRTGSGAAPSPGLRPGELDQRLLAVADMRPAAAVALPQHRVDRTARIVLGGWMHAYRWTINGRVYGEHVPINVAEGERVRLQLLNGR